MKRINGRLEGIITLLSPLSHIGESHGPDSYLATQEIIGPDGMPIEVFTYSGNAMRGLLRDTGAKYFLDRLAGKEAFLQIPLEIFYMLFSGGAIGGEQKIDIDQARRIRQAIPILSLFGAGVGNQILSGKIFVNDALPICYECSHIIPARYLTGQLISWRQMTTERSFTRKDDAKDDRLRPYLQVEEKTALQAPEQQQFMLEEGDTEKKAKKKEKSTEKKEKENPQQMRYTVEVFQAGAQLWHRIDFHDLNEIELGALVSCFVEFSKKPYIGGQSRIGMGRVRLDYELITDETQEMFLQIDTDSYLLGPTATEAKARYDEYLAEYNKYLADNKQRLVMLVDGKESKNNG